jgi:hypothetical protein
MQVSLSTWMRTPPSPSHILNALSNGPGSGRVARASRPEFTAWPRPRVWPLRASRVASALHSVLGSRGTGTLHSVPQDRRIAIRSNRSCGTTRAEATLRGSVESGLGSGRATSPEDCGPGSPAASPRSGRGEGGLVSAARMAPIERQSSDPRSSHSAESRRQTLQSLDA